MASANALAPLRWKRAKIHRASRRRRRSLTPHQEAGYTSAVVTLGPAFAKPVAIGRGPYTSRHDRYLREAERLESTSSCHANRGLYLAVGKFLPSRHAGRNLLTAKMHHCPPSS